MDLSLSGSKPSSTMMLIPCSMVFSHWLRCVSVTSNSSLKDKNSIFPTFDRLHGLSVVTGGAGAARPEVGRLKVTRVEVSKVGVINVVSKSDRVA